MSGPRAGAQVGRLVEELGHFHGYRTLWLDRRGYLCHSEPDDEWEAHGYTYVATVMRPGSDELTSVLGAFFDRRREADEVRAGVVPLLAMA
ncbi:MAG: hypothetical protein R3B09_08140 [Nannocystaceae bacterium]